MLCLLGVPSHSPTSLGTFSSKSAVWARTVITVKKSGKVGVGLGMVGGGGRLLSVYGSGS